MNAGAKPLYPVPRRTSTIAMILFLLALGVLFASSMVAYFAIRLLGTAHPQPGTLHLPWLLWVSTVLIIASSFTVSRALRAVRGERQKQLRANLVYTLALAIAFVGVQTPAMVWLLRTHLEMPQTGVRLYGMLFFLILLHAAHVLGGLGAFAIVIRGAYAGRYDHEHYTGIRNAAWYWHFLDIVWIVMFFSMLVVG